MPRRSMFFRTSSVRSFTWALYLSRRCAGTLTSGTWLGGGAGDVASPGEYADDPSLCLDVGHNDAPFRAAVRAFFRTITHPLGRMRIGRGPNGGAPG